MPDSGNLVYYILDGETVYAEKFDFRVQLTKQNFAELRMMRALENDNVNRFIGLVTDAPMYLVVWRYCSRGSLQGLAAMHSSAIGYHGMLTSANCLIDERWQVKIANFGLHYLRQLKKLTDDDLLWTAPEMLRDSTSQGTKSADMYSFAIIASELMCLTPPWNLGERKERSAGSASIFSCN
uniref:guanylate cyclase n=1 Tax=Ascaris lumbricoides TaxID=6252 RepID=A0A0M3IU85_ASCLU